MNKLRPIGNRIAIEIIDKRTESKSGIFIGNITVNDGLIPDRGIVYAVCNGENEFAIGEKVCFETCVGDKIKWDDKDILILHRDYVLGKLPVDADVTIRRTV